MLALFRRYPSFADLNFGWLAKLVDDIPQQSETEQRERRAAKQIPYSDLEKVAPAIPGTRKAAARKSPERLAWVVQLELLITLLKVGAWRQRNLREARVTGQTPNLQRGSGRNPIGGARPNETNESLRLQVLLERCGQRLMRGPLAGPPIPRRA